MLADIVERGDGQRKEQRLGVDGREEDRGRKDRDVENRSVCDDAIVLVFDQFIEEEQSEEECDVGDDEAGDQVVPDEPTDDADEERIEREERHLCSVVAAFCDGEVVDRVPAPPNRQQRIAGDRDVRSGALPDDHRREFGDEDDRKARRDEGAEDVADGVHETRGDQQFRERPERERDECHARGTADPHRHYETERIGGEECPRDGVPLHRAHDVDPGAAREVVTVAVPGGRGQHDAERERAEEGRFSRSDMQTRDRGVPQQKTE